MPYFYLISSIFLISASGIFGTFFNRKSADWRSPSQLYNFIFCLVAFLGWTVLFFSFDPVFDFRVVLWALGFGLSYAVCVISQLYALRNGPVSLTTLFLQLSLIAATIWGFFFWNTQFSLLIGVGLFLVVISLWLCLYTGKEDGEKGGKLSLKWLLFALLTFLGNSGCTIIQRSQQMAFDGRHGNLMMMCALFFATLFTLVRYLMSDRTDSKKILKSAVAFPIVSGICNVMLNLFIILLATSPISPSIVYPVVAVGGLSFTSIFSLLIFKEKLRWWQWLGIAVGTVAVMLLSM